MKFQLKLYCIVILVFVVNFVSCLSKQKSEKVFGESVVSSDKPQSFKKIAPLTANSLGSRKNLYEHGWAVIPSGKKAIDLSKENLMSANVAKAMVLVKLKKRSEDFPGKLGSTMNAVKNWTKEGYSDGTKRTEDIYDAGVELSKEEWKLSKSSFSEAGDRFVLGYVYLVPRVKSDIDVLDKELSRYADARDQKSSQLNQLFTSTLKTNSKDVMNSWSNSFKKASDEFTRNYEESGERDNALLALVDIFQGYTVALKEVVISPVAKTTANTGEVLLVNGVYVPLSQGMNFSSNALVSTGLVLYYGTKSGYRVFSPTLEAGLFSSIGILSASATVPTYTTGTSVALFNQVTSVAATTAGGAIGTTGGVGIESAAYATGLTYDLTTGVAEAGMYTMSSGIVLGYTALTALPPQILLTAVDGPIFITYDGPRVVIAVVKGNFAGYDDIPTGTVINLEEAKKQGRVKVLTDDPKVIKKVLDAEMSEQLKRSKKLEAQSK
ncbi:hypothetical protein EHQ59_00210 [Leptospira kemamanensis]|uniref:Uncharacterized protein n=1 Tax=Leptospira kemamanensis TaxID=2484942 RepID=A0A4R9JX35_9LEPT|nr:hypothetical protein [Leptospira kemamanensis]TGL57022.1 hypothetical protein EHQ59_00210 [Leptospira kemamanensis]